MIIAMFALIALGSILIYSGSRTDGDESETGTSAPQRTKTDDTPPVEPDAPDWALELRARVRPGRVRRQEEARQTDAQAGPAPTVVEDVQNCREADELLVLEYDRHSPAPQLELTHDEADGVSSLYADGKLVLTARARPGTPPLHLSEIALAPS